MTIPYKKHSFDKSSLKDIPKKPGVYQMIDSEGIIMYIGKSNRLNSRVRSYFNKEHETEKLNRMVMFVDKIIVLETETHLDAMLLEVELIKANRPLYNSQFKKSDNYNYLSFGSQPILTISNTKPTSRFLGPFRNSEYLEHFRSLINKLAPFDKELVYHVIPKRLSKEEVLEAKEYVFNVLTNEAKFKAFRDNLETLMDDYAKKLEFETAAFMKFSITVIDYLARTTLSQVDCIYYDQLEDRIKAYKISEYTVIGYNYFEKVDLINDNFIEVNDQIPEKDILDHQLVVYHELRKNPKRIIKIDQ